MHTFIEFFVFDYASLPYLLSSFCLAVTFPLDALDKNLILRKNVKSSS